MYLESFGGNPASRSLRVFCYGHLLHILVYYNHEVYEKLIEHFSGLSFAVQTESLNNSSDIAQNNQDQKDVFDT